MRILQEEEEEGGEGKLIIQMRIAKQNSNGAYF